MRLIRVLVVLFVLASPTVLSTEPASADLYVTVTPDIGLVSGQPSRWPDTR